MKNEITEITFNLYLEHSGYELLSEYTNDETPVWLKCPHGHEFKIKPEEIFNGCSVCQIDHGWDRKSIGAYNRILRKLDSYNYKLLSEYENIRTFITIECDKGHIYNVHPYQFKKGFKCSACKGVNSFYNAIELEKLANKLGYELIGEYVNSKTSIWMKTPIGRVRKISPAYIKNLAIVKGITS